MTVFGITRASLARRDIGTLTQGLSKCQCMGLTPKTVQHALPGGFLQSQDHLLAKTVLLASMLHRDQLIAKHSYIND